MNRARRPLAFEAATFCGSGLKFKRTIALVAMNISCFGLRHRTDNLSSGSALPCPGALQPLRQVSGVDAAVILSTCNRTGSYLAGLVIWLTPEAIFG